MWHMSPTVRKDAETNADWDDDAVTQIDEYGPRAIRHRNLLRAVLLFHSGVIWGPAERVRWKLLTGSEEATGRSLCDAIRASGISIDELLR